MRRSTATTAASRTPSIRLAHAFAWPAFKARFSLFAAILLTIFASWLALQIVFVAGQRFGILLWAAAHLIFLAFFSGLQVGLLQISLALHDGKPVSFNDAFTHLALGPEFLVAQLIYWIMVLAGLVLLVLPGVYLGVRYAFLAFPWSPAIHI